MNNLLENNRNLHRIAWWLIPQLKNGTLEFFPGRFRLAGISLCFVHLPWSNVTHQVIKNLFKQTNLYILIGNQCSESERSTQVRLWLIRLRVNKRWKGYIHFIDVLSSFGWSFYVRYSPLLCAILSLFQRHFPPFTQVAFIAHQKKRYVLIVLHSQYLFSEIKKEKEKEKPIIST